jgi:hypothetical protein
MAYASVDVNICIQARAWWENGVAKAQHWLGQVCVVSREKHLTSRKVNKSIALKYDLTLTFSVRKA